MTGRIPVTDVRPVVSCGAYPAKAVVGETFEVTATVFREGHDAVNATVVLRDPTGAVSGRAPMRPGAPGLDRWHADVTPDAAGQWSFEVEGWGDPMATWRHDAGIKVPVGQDVELMLEEGALLFERAAKELATGADLHRQVAADLRDTSLSPEQRLGAGMSREVLDALRADPLRDLVTTEGPFDLLVERERALFGSWYEMFPRSEGAVRRPDGTWRSGTFATAAERLPAIAAMGFDVVYLPPIHPIGRTFRKGPNNTLDPGPGDPGVPWAIGSAEGGHDTVHADLGTMADFDAFVARAGELGLEVALDLALQASPDHPWVTEHPEWFSARADGSIAYAENPPKKYQDIYPVNFDRDPEGIYAEVLRIVRLWASHGVRIFRVDNPHTKPVSFWHRLLTELRASDPDLIFLAEAFTRPAMMHTLAKVGFTQSYTYFTWRNERWELEQYLRDLSGETATYMRPNFFVNTPDILPASLQYGGPAAFAVRAILAATLVPTWGVYSGFELYEHVAVRPGSEEYLDSEKYQYRPRDWAAYDAGGRYEGQSLSLLLGRLNYLRRIHPALQWLRNLHFHSADDPSVIVYSKRRPLAEGGHDTVLVVVNLDPHGTREATVSLDMPALGLDWQDGFAVHDELTGATFSWAQRNYVRLDPSFQVAHVFAVRRNW